MKLKKKIKKKYYQMPRFRKEKIFIFTKNGSQINYSLDLLALEKD